MNYYIKIFLVSLFALLLPVFLVSEGIFKDYSFAAIGIVLIFYYPIYSIAVGMYAGIDMKSRWRVNLIFPALFSMLFFGIFRIDEFIFISFPAGYFLCGIITTYITNIVATKRREKKENQDQLGG